MIKRCILLLSALALLLSVTACGNGSNASQCPTAAVESAEPQEDGTIVLPNVDI